MCDIDLVKLRSVAFDFLDSFDDLTNVSIRQLRRHCEEELDFPLNSLTGVDEKEILASIVGEYAEGLEGDKCDGRPRKSDGSFRIDHRRFSKPESDQIMSYVKDYIVRNDLDMEAVCCGMRDGSSKRRIAHKIWKELEAIMTNRSHLSIKQHAERKLMHEFVSTKGWTAEDKALLLSLHEQHQGNFTYIGRTMGRMSSECRSRYITLTQQRLCSGKFTPSEDYDLVAAVKKVRGLSKNTPLKNIPNKGTKWTEVVKLLGFKRQRLDYLRRWPALKRFYIDNPTAFPTSSNGDSPRKDSKVPLITVIPGMKGGSLHMPWLLALKKRSQNITHPTEINFADVDRELCLPHSGTVMRWRRLCRHLNEGWSFQEKLEHLIRLCENEGSIPIPKRKPLGPRKKKTVRKTSKSVDEKGSLGSDDENNKSDDDSGDEDDGDDEEEEEVEDNEEGEEEEKKKKEKEEEGHVRGSRKDFDEEEDIGDADGDSDDALSIASDPPMIHILPKIKREATSSSKSNQWVCVRQKDADMDLLAPPPSVPRARVTAAQLSSPPPLPVTPKKKEVERMESSSMKGVKMKIEREVEKEVVRDVRNVEDLKTKNIREVKGEMKHVVSKIAVKNVPSKGIESPSKRRHEENESADTLKRLPMSEKKLDALQREYTGNMSTQRSVDGETGEDEIVATSSSSSSSSSKDSKALKRREKEEEQKKQKRVQAYNDLIAFQKSCLGTSTIVTTEPAKRKHVVVSQRGEGAVVKREAVVLSNERQSIAAKKETTPTSRPVVPTKKEIVPISKHSDINEREMVPVSRQVNDTKNDMAPIPRQAVTTKKDVRPISRHSDIFMDETVYGEEVNGAPKGEVEPNARRGGTSTSSKEAAAPKEREMQALEIVLRHEARLLLAEMERKEREKEEEKYMENEAEIGREDEDEKSRIALEVAQEIEGARQQRKKERREKREEEKRALDESSSQDRKHEMTYRRIAEEEEEKRKAEISRGDALIAAIAEEMRVAAEEAQRTNSGTMHHRNGRNEKRARDAEEIDDVEVEVEVINLEEDEDADGDIGGESDCEVQSSELQAKAARKAVRSEKRARKKKRREARIKEMIKMQRSLGNR